MCILKGETYKTGTWWKSCRRLTLINGEDSFLAILACIIPVTISISLIHYADLLLESMKNKK
jgi:hypothetical protein